MLDNSTPPDSELPSHVMSGLLRALVSQIASVIDEVDGAVFELEEAFCLLAQKPSDDPAELEARLQISQSLQFHDRMEQRLKHVSRGLEEVSQLLENQVEALSLEHWHALADSLRRASAIEVDKHVFTQLGRAQPDLKRDNERKIGGQPDSAGNGEVELF